MKSSIPSFFVFTALLLFSFCAKDGSSDKSEKTTPNETELNVNNDAEPTKNVDQKKMSDEEQMVEKMKSFFVNNGFDKDQVDDVLEIVLNLSQIIPTNSKDFEIPSETQSQLKNDLGLADNQIEIVKMAAMRVANKKEQAGNFRTFDREKKLEENLAKFGFKDMEKLKKSLKENGVTDEQMEGALGGLVRVLHEVNAEGESFQLDQGVRNYLQKRVKLNEAQIQFIQETAVSTLNKTKE